MKTTLITIFLYCFFAVLFINILDNKEDIPNAFNIAIVCIGILTYIGLYRIIKLTIKTLKNEY